MALPRVARAEIQEALRWVWGARIGDTFLVTLKPDPRLTRVRSTTPMRLERLYRSGTLWRTPAGYLSWLSWADWWDGSAVVADADDVAEEISEIRRRLLGAS